MRKLIGSVMIGLGLVAALMVFVSPSLALRPAAEQVQQGQPPDPGRPDPLPRRERRVSLHGTIAVLPTTSALTGTWKITDETNAPRSVTVTLETKIVPSGTVPMVGDGVHVVGTQDGGDEAPVLATHIVVEQGTARRARPMEFRGLIDNLPSASTDELEGWVGNWVVSGMTVEVDSETRIHPPGRTPTIGMRVNGIAFLQPDGGYLAKNIALHRMEDGNDVVEIEGKIQDLPPAPYTGTWVVDKYTVTVTADTEQKGATPALSLTARVEGQQQSDGSILAREIIVRGPEHEEVEFEGELLVFSTTHPSTWAIKTDAFSGTDTISVTVTEETRLRTEQGPLAEGAWVEVKALWEGEDLVAVQIKVEDDECCPRWEVLEGTIDYLDGGETYLLLARSGYTDLVTVTLTENTRRIPPTAVLTQGLSVKIGALRSETDAYLAAWIKVERPDFDEIEFEGTIVQTDTIPNGEWVVQGDSERFTFTVDSETHVRPSRADLVLSATVEVKAIEMADGLYARRIEVEMPEPEEFEFEGTIVVTDSIPGEWVILSGTERVTFTLDLDTDVRPGRAALVFGASVEIEAVEEDGKLYAVHIEVETPEFEILEGILTKTSDELPGDWVISHTEPVTVHVTNLTALVPNPAAMEVGTSVKAKAVEIDEVLYALWIKLDGGPHGGWGDDVDLQDAPGTQKTPLALAQEEAPTKPSSWMIRRYDRRLGGPIE